MTVALSRQHGCVPNPDGSCSICADEAFPGLVLSVDPTDNTAQVQLPAEVATVALDLIEVPYPGDSVMVHMGFAISRIDSGDNAIR